MRNILSKVNFIRLVATLSVSFSLAFFLMFAGDNAIQAQTLVPTVGGGSPVLDSVQAQVTAPTVDIIVIAPVDPINENDTFIVLVAFDPSHFVKVGAFQWYLNFDPTKLQLVASTPTNDVEPGAPFASGRFKDVLQNSSDNVLGQVDFAGGTGIAGQSTVAPFVTAAIRFRATSATAGTAISFGITPPRQTKVLTGLTDVTGNLNGVTIEIVGSAPLSDLFNVIP